MTTTRSSLWLVLALGAGCFSPSPQGTDEDPSSSGATGPPIDGGSTSAATSDANETSTSGLESTGPTTAASSDPSTASSGDTTSNPDCPAAVFGRSVFGDACFQ